MASKHGGSRHRLQRTAGKARLRKASLPVLVSLCASLLFAPDAAVLAARNQEAHPPISGAHPPKAANDLLAYPARGDAAQFSTLPGSAAAAGAGMAMALHAVSFAPDAGYAAGSTGSNHPRSGAGVLAGANQGTPGPIFIPIVQATAGPDGSIIHIVQTGQTMIGIATVYGVPLEDLFAFNGLTANSFINPGDEIIVKPPRTPTPTVSRTPTASATSTVTQTPTPTITARPALSLAATAEGAVTPTPTATQLTAAALFDTETTRGRLLLAIVAGAFLFLMVPFIASLRRRP